MPESKKIGMVSSFEELRREKFVPFILSPLYFFLDLPMEVSLIRKFIEEEEQADAYHTEYDFAGFPLTTMPKPWTSRIWVMDDTRYPAFKSWLESFEFMNRKIGMFAVARCTSAPVNDPFVRILDVEKPRPEIIHIWTPSTPHTFIKPLTHVETIAHPIFREGEAEDLSRADFLSRLPRPVSAPDTIELVSSKPDPTVVLRASERAGEV